MKGGRPKVVVSMPCHSDYSYEMVRTVFDMLTFTASQGYSYVPHFSKGSNIAINRTNGVELAQNVESEYVLWVDSDTVMPPDSLVKLLKADRKIVSGLYFGKQPPFVPIAAMKCEDSDNGYKPLEDFPENQIIPVDAVGGGFLLVKTSVFLDLPKPWFSFEPVDGKPYPYGEDWYFCRKAQAAGHTINLHTGVLLGHVGSHIFSVRDFRGFQEAHRKVQLIT